MDKGLELIKELKKDIENLQLQRKENQDKIQFIEQKKAELDKRLENLKNNLKRNMKDKDDILSAPELYKKERKELLKTILKAVVSAFVFMSCMGGICAIFEGVEILLHILKLTITGLPLCGGAMFFMFNSLLKKTFTQEDILEIEKTISEIEEEMVENKEKQKELNNTLGHLRKIELELLNQISKLTSEKENIESIRTQLINDYCSNNPEFERLFDIALNSEKEQNKDITVQKKK